MTGRINVRFLFFGSVSDLMGSRESEIDLALGLSVKEAFEVLAGSKGELSGLKLRYAINQEFADDNKVVVDGDVIAVFTPVSGG